jgi:hypothetical protein
MKFVKNLCAVLALVGYFLLVPAAKADVSLVTPTPLPPSTVVVTTTPAVENPVLSPTACPTTANGSGSTDPKCIVVDQKGLGFRIPTFSEILTFTIRAFFIVSGLAALFFLLLGAFAWITSGGEKEKVGEAQKKIQAAVIGLIMIVVVLSLVITLEQVVFGGKLCFGLSCPITLPSLLKDPNSSAPPPAVGSFQLLDESPTATASPAVTVVVTPTPVPSTALSPSPTPVPDTSLSNHPYR